MKHRYINKYMLITILVLVLVAVYAAVGLLQVDIPKSPMKISVVLENSGSPRWASYMEGIELAAEESGVELSSVTTGYFTGADEEEALRSSEIADGADTVLGAISPDAKSTASMLLSAMVSDYNSGLMDRTVAILAGSGYDEYNVEVVRLLREGIEKSGGEVFWEKHTPYSVTKLLKKSKSTDIVIAIDDDSLTQAAAYLSGKRGRGRRLYGIGCSSANAYYLDRGVISAMVFCDYFTAGYKSIEALAALRSIEDIRAEVRLIRPGEVYSEENENRLFP